MLYLFQSYLFQQFLVLGADGKQMVSTLSKLPDTTISTSKVRSEKVIKSPSGEMITFHLQGKASSKSQREIGAKLTLCIQTSQYSH